MQQIVTSSIECQRTTPKSRRLRDEVMPQLAHKGQTQEMWKPRLDEREDVG